MNTYTISTKSRNLAFGWTNKPSQFYNSRGDSYLGFKQPTAPRERGGVRSVEREMEQARKLNSGNDWYGALFVDGQRVVEWNPCADEWRELDRFGLSRLLEDLREGFEIAVRTEEATDEA